MKKKEEFWDKRRIILLFFISVTFIALSILFRNYLSQFKSLGILGIFLINFFGNATLFLPAPAIASVVAGGLVYPPILVALASSLGAALGDLIGFSIGHSGKSLFIKNHHRWYMIFKDLFHKFGLMIVFIFAFFPNPFFDAIGIVAGVFGIPLKRFFVALLLGRLLRNLLLAYFGSLF